MCRGGCSDNFTNDILSIWQFVKRVFYKRQFYKWHFAKGQFYKTTILQNDFFTNDFLPTDNFTKRQFYKTTIWQTKILQYDNLPNSETILQTTILQKIICKTTILQILREFTKRQFTNNPKRMSNHRPGRNLGSWFLVHFLFHVIHGFELEIV